MRLKIEESLFNYMRKNILNESKKRPLFFKQAMKKGLKKIKTKMNKLGMFKISIIKSVISDINQCNPSNKEFREKKLKKSFLLENHLVSNIFETTL